MSQFCILTGYLQYGLGMSYRCSSYSNFIDGLTTFVQLDSLHACELEYIGIYIKNCEFGYWSADWALSPTYSVYSILLPLQGDLPLLVAVVKLPQYSTANFTHGHLICSLLSSNCNLLHVCTTLTCTRKKL